MNTLQGIILLASMCVLSTRCNPEVTEKENRVSILAQLSKQPHSFINTQGKTIKTRVVVPDNFIRKSVAPNSFEEFLQNLPLKPNGSKVKTYDGQTKESNGVYVAVVDLPIGKKDLHQCADAVMRLRMDYLYQQKRYDEIHFNFTNGMRVNYSEWMRGKRMVISGNRTYWKQSKSPSNTPQDFLKYKELIYMYAGTASLARELNKIPIQKIQIGDVFIKGGSPGHAVIVVDMATSSTGEKIFLLAQSYMPAQEIQVLSNPMNAELSPWYSTKNLPYLQTPEWEFEIDELMQF